MSCVQGDGLSASARQARELPARAGGGLPRRQGLWVACVAWRPPATTQGMQAAAGRGPVAPMGMGGGGMGGGMGGMGGGMQGGGRMMGGDDDDSDTIVETQEISSENLFQRVDVCSYSGSALVLEPRSHCQNHSTRSQRVLIYRIK